LPPARKHLPLITLGAREDDSPFHLEVQLDPRGACVRQLILNKFKRASDTGRPEEGVLTLIPPDLHLGSNVLYHYDPDRPKSDYPLDTLGRVDWDVAEVRLDGESQ